MKEAGELVRMGGEDVVLGLWCWCCQSSAGNQPISGAWQVQSEPHGVGRQHLPASPHRMLPALDRNVIALWVRNPQMCS